MRYCPFCGAALAGIAFCSECGKSLPDNMGQRQPQIPARSPRPGGNATGRPVHPRAGSPRKAPRHPRSQGRRISGVSHTPSARPNPVKQKAQASGNIPRQRLMDENYDGYYDDVPTADNGQTREKRDPELMNRVALVAAGTLGIIILSVVIMYLL